MGKWNFDAIFSGTMEEQERKANYFAEGVRAQLKDYKAAYASYVLSDEPTSAERALKQAENYTAAHEALVADPRGVALRKWIDDRDATKAAEVLATAIIGAISQERAGGHRQ